MATILQLVEQGSLVKLDPALVASVQEMRVIYMSPDLKRRIEEAVPAMGSNWNIEVTPLEQLDALVALFAAGDQLVLPNDFRPIQHIKDGIWELKTADLRMFGWFYKKDCFVGHRIDQTQHIKDHKLYYGYATEVARFRDQLDLDEPKFVPGDDPNDVVSNCYLA